MIMGHVGFLYFQCVSSTRFIWLLVSNAELYSERFQLCRIFNIELKITRGFVTRVTFSWKYLEFSVYQLFFRFCNSSLSC